MESREFESNDDGMEETFELEASIRSTKDVDSKFDSNEEDDSSSTELTLKSRKRQQCPRTEKWEFLNCRGTISRAMIIP